MHEVNIKRGLGRTFKRERQDRKISAVDACKQLRKLGVRVSQSTLSRVELNQVVPRYDIVAGLCVIYEINMMELVYS